MNTFGNIYRLTTCGESHGPAVAGIIDGMPAGLRVDTDDIQRRLDLRRPGRVARTTTRSETDKVELLSGVFDGVTTGAPIGFEVRNCDARSEHYDALSHAFRPGHADYTYTAKWGLRDYRGGGRSSARETVARVVGGALASQALATMGIKVVAYTSQIGSVSLDLPYTELPLDMASTDPLRCPDAAVSRMMGAEIDRALAERDTLGGVATCVITGCPAGLGQPVFGKLQAMLAGAMMSIGAAHGFEYGMGFAGASSRGSALIDTFTGEGTFDSISTLTNYSGGIQGGISNGADIYMRVAFKPIATMPRPVDTVDDSGRNISLEVRGRHDPCVLPRAIAVVEAMAAMTIFDAVLLDRTSRMK